MRAPDPTASLRSVDKLASYKKIRISKFIFLDTTAYY